MTRKSRPHSRNPGPGEEAAALQWELRRMRAEMKRLRQQLDEKSEAKGGLKPASRAALIRRIAIMFRNCVLHRIPDSDRCAHCGGPTEAQIMTAFAAWETDEAACVI